IEENEFDGVYDVGVIADDAGTYSNLIHGNIFESTYEGIVLYDDNSASQFLNNCFNTTSQDIYIVGDVNSTQGGTNPAGNCFTHGGNSMSSIGDIAGSHN